MSLELQQWCSLVVECLTLTSEVLGLTPSILLPFSSYFCTFLFARCPRYCLYAMRAYMHKKLVIKAPVYGHDNNVGLWSIQYFHETSAVWILQFGYDTSNMFCSKLEWGSVFMLVAVSCFLCFSGDRKQGWVSSAVRVRKGHWENSS